MEPPKVESNRYVFPIALDGESSGVTSMDFQVRYDPTVFTPVDVTPGASATAAGKVVDGNLSAPGTYSVLVMGLNQNGMPPGEVAQVVFERNPATGSTSSLLTIARPTLSDAQGTVLPATGGERTVALDASTPDPASPEKPAEADTPENPEPDPAALETPPTTPEVNALGGNLGQSVADAMLSGLSRPSEGGLAGVEKKKSAAVPEGNTPRVTNEAAPSVADTADGATSSMTQLGNPVQLPAAPSGGATSDSGSDIRQPDNGTVPARQAPEALSVEDGAASAVQTVEKPNDVLVPNGVDDDAQEGGQERSVMLLPALAVAALTALVLLAIWRRRKPAHS